MKRILFESYICNNLSRNVYQHFWFQKMDQALEKAAKDISLIQEFGEDFGDGDKFDGLIIVENGIVVFEIFSNKEIDTINSEYSEKFQKFFEKAQKQIL